MLKAEAEQLACLVCGSEGGLILKGAYQATITCCRDTSHSRTSNSSGVGVILLDWLMCGQTASERPGSSMHGTPQKCASHKAGRAKAGLDVAHGGQHSSIKDAP